MIRSANARQLQRSSAPMYCSSHWSDALHPAKQPSEDCAAVQQLQDEQLVGAPVGEFDGTAADAVVDAVVLSVDVSVDDAVVVSVEVAVVEPVVVSVVVNVGDTVGDDVGTHTTGVSSISQQYN